MANNNDVQANVSSGDKASAVPPPWRDFIRYCQRLGHGEIEKLKIQDGVPVMAEIVREKVKFT